MTQSLPARPNLQHLRNQAKDLHRAVNASDASALARVAAIHSLDLNHLTRFKLAEALLVIAREYGFPSWMKLKAHVNALIQTGGDHKEPEGDPKAKALLDAMFATIRGALSLTVKIHGQYIHAGHNVERHVAAVWLKKPRLARIDTVLDDSVMQRLVCDGKEAWISWPDSTEKQRQYRRLPALDGLAGPDVNTVADDASVLDLGTFHGIGTTRFERNIQSHQFEEAAILDGEPCSCVYVTYYDYGRYALKIWISEADLLPRQISYENENRLTTSEIWSNIHLNGSIPASQFRWQPPVGDTEWMPNPDSKIIQSGERAPEIDLHDVKGERCTLELLAGRTVVMTVGWLLQEVTHREQLCDMQRLARMFEPDGVSIIAITGFAGALQAMTDFLEREGITIPMCCPGPAVAWQIIEAYGIKALPSFITISPSGLVVEAWTEDYDRLEPAIRRSLNGETAAANN